MKVSLLLVYLLVSITANSQDFRTFKGQILRQRDSVPIFNAHIYFANTNIGTTTNENGMFRFHFPSKLKSTEINISCIGYKPYTTDEIQNQPKKIFLKEDQLQLDEITITAVNPVHILKKAIENMDNNYCNRTITKTFYYRESFKRNGEPLRNLEVVADLTSRGFGSKQQNLNKYDVIINQKRPGFNYDSTFNGGNGIAVLNSLSWTEKYLKKGKLKGFKIEFEGNSTFRNLDLYHISLKRLKNNPTVTSIYITKDNFAIAAIIESFVNDDKEKPGRGQEFRFLESTQYVDFIRLDDGFWYVKTIDDFRVSWNADETITETRRSVKVTSVDKDNRLVDSQRIDSRTDLYSYPIEYDEEFWNSYNVPPKTEVEQAKAKINH